MIRSRRFVVCICLALLIAAALTPAASSLLLAAAPRLPAADPRPVTDENHQEDSVSFKTSVRKIMFGGMLGLASLMGAAMRPEEIEAIMRDMNVPKVVHVLEDEDDIGDE